MEMQKTGYGRRAPFACQRRGGFTLLELLVVLVIIGLLAGYVGPKYFSQIGKSEVNGAQAQLDALGKALDQFRLAVGNATVIKRIGATSHPMRGRHHAL